MNNAKLTLGLAVLLALILLAIAGPSIGRSLFPDEDAMGIATYKRQLQPSAQHLIGTDNEGRDALVVLLNSIWPSLALGLIAGVTATLLGMGIGFVSGYAGGWVDSSLRTFVDMVLVFPTLPLFLILGLYIEKWNLFSMALLLGAFGWPYAARVVRAQVLSLRERSYIDLAKLSGESTLQIIAFELFPSLLPYIGLSIAGNTVFAMFTEAGLQFIGLGAGTLPTLGYMIGKGLNRGLISAGLHAQMLLPAGLLVLMFLSLNLVNMGLEEVFNPRLRTRVEDR